MDILGLLFGIGILCIWYFINMNWIISNFIYVCMFLCIIKFGSLKMAFITFCSTAILNVLFIVLTQ